MHPPIVPIQTSGLTSRSSRPNRQLTGAEIELVALDARERRLRRLLERRVRDDFDVIFIDTPPSLGLLTLNALVAADAVLVPLNLRVLRPRGHRGCLWRRSTACAPRSIPRSTSKASCSRCTTTAPNLGQQVSSDIREFFGDSVYQT